MDKQCIQQWILASMQRIGVGCMGQQCFHWSVDHGGGICLGIRRWLLGAIYQWWHSHQVCCRDIGCMIHWIASGVENRLGSELVHWSIGRSSCLGIGHSSDIQSFHHVFHKEFGHGTGGGVVPVIWTGVKAWQTKWKWISK